MGVFDKDNCPNCNMVTHGCMDECNQIVPQNGLYINWNSCKNQCSNNYDCAIWDWKWNGGDRLCYCANDCDNIKNEDQTVNTILSSDLAEGYILGIISTLFILFIGIIACYVYKKLFRKNKRKSKYEAVINIDTTDDEQVYINNK
mmetsp:Transcript_37259/g.32946  ORF Transcript_37259/g.32946 Transcript_37259/m.32946 type:complete len:145 (-) Transcript_37259:49-483(-)